jgi:multiple sugar transport system permease protein
VSLRQPQAAVIGEADLADRSAGDQSPAGMERSRIRRERRPTWLALPAGVLLVVVVGLPALLGIYLSFFNVNISDMDNLLSAPFVGFSNYVQTLTSPDASGGTALHSILISIGFAVLSTVIATPIGFAVALSVSHRFRGRAAFRSFFLVPYVIPTVVTASVARMMFLNGSGLVDQVLGHLGLGGQNMYWLIGPNTFWAMLATEVWIVWPFTYLMILAGLTSVPHELYEAVELDGCGYWGKLRHIVLPQVRGVLLLSILLSTIFHLTAFTLPFVMFGDPPPANADVLPVNVYYRAFTSGQYGVAAATAVIMLVVLLIPGYIYVRQTRLREASA